MPHTAAAPLRSEVCALVHLPTENRHRRIHIVAMTPVSYGEHYKEEADTLCGRIKAGGMTRVHAYEVRDGLKADTVGFGVS